jgi:PTS system fructose-specific IIC component
MPELITADLVRLDVDLGADKESVVRGLAAIAGEAGVANDVDRLALDALAREETQSTGLPGGVAIPHCRSTGTTQPFVALARLSTPVDFGAADRPADLVLMLGAPAGNDATHLTVLTRLARALVKPAFVHSLREASSDRLAARLVAEAVGRV